MYRILSGTNPDALVHEVGCTNETLARDVYRNMRFNRYAVLMCGDDVKDDNLKAGPTVAPKETDR